MKEKTLAPLDGSELGEIVLPYVEEFAGRLRAEVTLLHVDESPQDLYRLREDYLEDTVETVKEGIRGYYSKFDEHSINQVKSRVLFGNPAAEIVNYAEKEDMNLIIMSTHGRSGILRWNLGSVAEKVVRATRLPVLLVRAKGRKAGMRKKGILDKALVALDGSKEAERALAYISSIATRFETQITLLHVLPLGYHNMTSSGSVWTRFGDREIEPYQLVIGDYLEKPSARSEKTIYPSQQMESNEASAKDYLEDVGARLKAEGMKVWTEVRFGDPAEEIIKYADESQTDAVVVSAHGRSNIERWVFGSVAEKVLFGGNTPLLLVK